MLINGIERIVGPRANLYGADLYGANLGGANLYGANLYGANLRGADLRGADLGGANLRGADLYGADLGWANLRRADLRGANLGGAKIGEHSLLRLAGRAYRSDGYEFLCFATDESHVIRAGCRTFTRDEFIAHADASYPDTPKHAETMRILDFLDAQLAMEPWS